MRMPRSKKVVVLGDSQTGKTCLIHRCVKDTFSPIYKETTGADFLTKEVLYNEKNYDIQVWDTAGQEKFRSLGVVFYWGSDAAVVLFDVTSRQSFENVSGWVEEFRLQTSDDLPIIIVGNKTEEPEVVVSSQMVEELCSTLGDNIYFTFVDAKNGVRTAQLLEGVLRTLKGEKVFGERKSVKSARNVAAGSEAEETESAS